MKKIPYGLQDYESLKKENYYYVDKTSYIERLEAEGARYLMFLRPRRFGKSLFLSMLECYYDINKRDQFETLFKDTYIGKHPTELHNTYHVLKLDFSKVQVDGSYEDIQRIFNEVIYRSIRDFYIKYTDTTGGEASFNQEIKFSSSATSMFDEFISQMFKRQIVIYLLIDEYDNFANNILMQHGETSYLDTTQKGGFLRSFFACVKAATSNSTIHRFLITGVTPMVLSDITSGMNIQKNISMHPNFTTALGFSETECLDFIDYYVKEGLIKDDDKEELLAISKEYCNNYLFSDLSPERVYNADMFLFILDGYQSSKGIPSTLVDANIVTDYKKLRSLVLYDKKITNNFSILSSFIDNQDVISQLISQFSIEAITGKDAFISLLYYLGLVTIEPISLGDVFKFKIPNQTIREIHFNYIYKILEQAYQIQSVDFSSDIFKMGISGDWETALSSITDKFYEIASLRDFVKHELALKICLMTFFSINNLYTVYSERELNKGYADIYLEPSIKANNTFNFAYLIELKYIKAEENTPEYISQLEATATAQLKQYSIGKLNTNKTIKKIILIMSTKQVEVLKEVE